MSQKSKLTITYYKYKVVQPYVVSAQSKNSFISYTFRYGTHLWEISLEGTWENRGFYVYYTELVFELAALLVDFTHHLHMLVSL